jgi:triosephosphate isomerase
MFIAGNWKMNLSCDESDKLARGLAAKLGAKIDLDVAVCPPSVYIDAVCRAVAGSAVAVGAQNMYHEPKGAFTGEISGAMLCDLGCRYVILGHSERRHILGETNEAVNKKVKMALETGLIPIVCVGELLEERHAGRTGEVVQEQFDGSLADLTAEQMGRVVIAYEPVWAIGTGETATPDQAEEVHADLRRMLESRYNSEVAASVRIQYGGSVKPDNAGDLLSQENIDGALVGGASLDLESFLSIIEAGRVKA